MILLHLNTMTLTTYTPPLQFIFFWGGGEVADTKSFMYLSLIYTKISGKSVILLLIHRLTFFLETGLLEAFKI